MMEFKANVGDKVRVVKGGHDAKIKAGDIVEIERRRGNKYYVKGAVFESDTSKQFFLFASEFEVVERASSQDVPEDSPAVDGEPHTREQQIRKAATELGDLLARKNADYGNSFAEQYAEYGMLSALIRLDDKMRRLKTLRTAEVAQVKDEAIADSLLDMAGYALLAYVEEAK